MNYEDFSKIYNQRIIIIKKENNNFINLKEAYKLNPNCFKIYIQLINHKNNEVFALDRAKLCEELSISKPTYLSSFSVLVSLGYLKQIDKIEKTNNEIYEFYEKIK